MVDTGTMEQKVITNPEMAKTFAAELIGGLLAMGQAGEWVSLSFNLTAGPKEAPVIFLNLCPGTTPENAKGIQDEFIVRGRAYNLKPSAEITGPKR